MSNTRVDLFNGVKIIIEATGSFYHTYEDWGLYVTNTDYIKEPKQYTKYIEIPGRNGLLDLSEAISGRQIYTSREIKINLAGHRNKVDWDSTLSAFRNNINGKICRLIFDNDTHYYWRGRIEIKDFSSALNFGKFVIDVPNADPYKYSVLSSADPWLWDPFNFLTDVVTYVGAITVTGSKTVTIPHGHMATSPELVVSDQTSATFTVTVNNITYPLTAGTNRIPSILVGGDNEVDLTFTGDAKIQIVYRSGSL